MEGRIAFGSADYRWVEAGSSLVGCSTAEGRSAAALDYPGELW